MRNWIGKGSKYRVGPQMEILFRGINDLETRTSLKKLVLKLVMPNSCMRKSFNTFKLHVIYKKSDKLAKININYILKTFKMMHLSFSRILLDM